MRTKIYLLMVAIIFFTATAIFFDDIKLYFLSGKKMPNVALNDFSQNQPSLSKFEGRTAVVLFWKLGGAEQLSAIQQLQQVLNSSILSANQIVIVNVNESKLKKEVTEFIDTNEISIPIFLDFENKILNEIDVLRTPFLVVVAKDGKIKWATHSFDANLSIKIKKEFSEEER